MKKATRQHTKSHNIRLILRTIYEQGNISRAELARTTHLTRPTVSDIVRELMSNHFVVETGQGPSAGGKRPTLLSVAHADHNIIALDLGSREFRGAIVNLKGKIIKRLFYPTGGKKGADALALVDELIDTMVKAAKATVLGVGIGTPGLTDQNSGVIYESVNLEWSNIPLRQRLEDRFDLPIYVANDSHMAALGEYTFGNHLPGENLVVIKIGQGVGAGIVLEGKLFYGDGYGAGEIGHIFAVEDGELCSCGRHGCLETMTSTRALSARARDLNCQANKPQQVEAGDATWQTLVTALEKEDEQVGQLITQAGRYLGVALSHVVGILNIHTLILAGRVSDLGQVFLDAILAEIRQRVLPSLATDTKVAYSNLGRDIVVLGSSAMVLQHELGIV